MIVFFFQAEDGIRDLVRSRGLGDVYKRQVKTRNGPAVAQLLTDDGKVEIPDTKTVFKKGHIAVSYTHLTLPTSDLV